MGRSPFYKLVKDYADKRGVLIKKASTARTRWNMIFGEHFTFDSNSLNVHNFVGKSKYCVDYGLGTNDGKWYKEVKTNFHPVCLISLRFLCSKSHAGKAWLVLG